MTKCLRNNKHALAFEPTLHLGESREVTQEPHANETQVHGAGKERTSAPHTASPLARQNMLLIMTPINSRQK